MIPQARFVGPADALDDSIRSGAPEYQGGKIHEPNPAAAAKLREFWSKQPAKAQKGKKDPDDNPALSLERTGHQRRQARLEAEQGDTMNRTNVNPQERALLAGMIAGGASDEALQEWRISRGINGNTFKSVVREIRGGAPPPPAAEDRDRSAAGCGGCARPGRQSGSRRRPEPGD